MYQTIWQFLQMILPLVTSPILARALHADGIGIFTYTSTIVSYFVLVANLGMYQYGIREIAEVRDNIKERSKVFFQIIYLHIIIAIFVGIIYFIYVLFFSEYPIYMSILFLTYIGGVLNINWLYFGMEEFKFVTIRDVCLKLITFILILILIHDEDDLLLYIVLMSIGSFASNLLYYLQIKKYIIRISVSLRESLKRIKGLLLLFVPMLLESFYNMLDKLMLGIMNTKESVGYYENAGKAMIAKTLIYSISIVIMPRMSKLIANQNDEEADKLMRQSTAIIIFLSIALSFGTAAVSKEFAVLFWGNDFLPSANLMIILALSIPANVLSREIRQQYLIPAKKDHDYMLAAAIGAITDIVLNLFFIPLWGAIGAAISTLITEYVVLLMQVAIVRRNLLIVSYIVRGNWFYPIIGVIMYFFVKNIGSYMGIHIYTLITEILLGILIYGSCCMVYWKVTKQSFFLDQLRLVFRRKRTLF
jgi:O-antigen/teichoic acid export membrane protein